MAWLMKVKSSQHTGDVIRVAPLLVLMQRLEAISKRHSLISKMKPDKSDNTLF